MNKELVQLINIIHYRFEKSLKNHSEKYLAFKPRNEARSPSEIFLHLVEVSNYGINISNAPKPIDSNNSISEKVNENLKAMKSYLSNNEVDEETAKKLINGPLSDTLTHIGQLSLIRRLEGKPIDWENYTNAAI